MRFYFTNLRYRAEDDAYYSPLSDHQLSVFDSLDGREFMEIEDGWLFVWTDNTDAEHQQLLLQPDVIYLPTEDAGGTLLGIDTVVSSVSAANRAFILAEFQAHGIPTLGITGAMTIRQVMRIVIARLRIMERLRYVDFSETLTETVSAIPAKRRKALNKRLTNLGFDLSGITGSMTVEEALYALFSQDKIPLNLFPF